MRGQHHDAAAGDKRFHTLMRLFQECGIAGSEPLVHQENFRTHRCRHGKAQANHHARRVGSYRHVYIVSEAAELDDLVYVGTHLTRMHIHVHCAINNVFTARRIRVEPYR